MLWTPLPDASASECLKVGGSIPLLTMKALLRKAAKLTIDALWTEIGEIVALFKPAECANYLGATGYDAL